MTKQRKVDGKTPGDSRRFSITVPPRRIPTCGSAALGADEARHGWREQVGVGGGGQQPSAGPQGAHRGAHGRAHGHGEQRAGGRVEEGRQPEGRPQPRLRLHGRTAGRPRRQVGNKDRRAENLVRKKWKMFRLL